MVQHIIGRSRRDIQVPDEPSPPRCPDGCDRPMRRDSVGRGLWRCPECGVTLHPSTIERMGAMASAERALEDAEEYLSIIFGAIGEGTDVPIAQVEGAATHLGRMLSKVQGHLETVSACLADEGVRVE